MGEAIKADNDDPPSLSGDGKQFVYFQFEWLIRSFQKELWSLDARSVRFCSVRFNLKVAQVSVKRI